MDAGGDTEGKAAVNIAPSELWSQDAMIRSGLSLESEVPELVQSGTIDEAALSAIADATGNTSEQVQQWVVAMSDYVTGELVHALVAAGLEADQVAGCWSRRRGSTRRGWPGQRW